MAKTVVTFTKEGFENLKKVLDEITARRPEVSPIGSALIGKKAGDEVEVEIPDGNIKYKIASHFVIPAKAGIYLIKAGSSLSRG